MNIRRPHLLIAALSLAMLPRAALAQQGPAGRTELVVDFADGTSEATADAVVRGLGFDDAVPNSAYASVDGVYRVSVPTARVSEALERLDADGHVEAADVNREMHSFFVPNDPMLSQQWGLARVGTERSWDVTCGRGVTVAVIDMGVA